jgi:hypothetical protein
VIALLQPSGMAVGYLDPDDTGPSGAHALTDILASRGDTVIREVTPAAAQAAAGKGGATLVVTSPDLLNAGQLASLARVRANLVLVGPDGTSLAAFAPGVSAVGTFPPEYPPQPLPPGCSLPAAQQAGSAGMGGLLMMPGAAEPGAAQCYQAAASESGLPGASLVQYSTGGRVVTLLGTGTPLTNRDLAQYGNAALALNLLAGRSRIVWLVPGPGLAANGTPNSGGNGQQSPSSLVPLAAYLIALQLGIAAVLAALWRMRRLGSLVPERLPVVVRASETVEGLAGLYRSRRARDRAAAALRTAMLGRTLPGLGLAPGTQPAEVISAVSSRSGSDAPTVAAMLYGPAPADDAALVALAGDLDTLERKVRGQ